MEFRDPIVENTMQQAAKAAEEFERKNQHEVDEIVTAVYYAAFNNRIDLARMAFEETGIGKFDDKVLKNVIASRFVYRDIKDLKTVGVIAEDPENGITEIARPMGPIFAITPLTNPTSTVIFKILISLKTRNPIIISPHGSARKASIRAAQLCYEAALQAGAPENCIQWLRRTTKEQVIEFMGHKKTALVLATGSVGLVKAAYSSGNPALGVGPGNVPCYIDEDVDSVFAVRQILISKTFDNGTICASEQSLLVHQNIAQSVKMELINQNCYFLTYEEIEKLEPVAFNKAMKVMNVEVIGRPAFEIAEMAGFKVPRDTSVLIAPLDKVGIESPLSLEILAPILAYYEVPDFDAALALSKLINRYGGLGHTASIFSNNEEHIRKFSCSVNAGRIVVNTPSSQGAMGGTYNTLIPSLTLACGSKGNNLTTDNISAKHLINIQRIARRKQSICGEHLGDCHYLLSEIKAENLSTICRHHNTIQTAHK